MAFVASTSSVPYVADDRPRLDAAGLADMAAQARASGLAGEPSIGDRAKYAGISLFERVASGKPLVSFGAQADVGPYSVLIAYAPVIGFLGFLWFVFGRARK